MLPSHKAWWSQKVRSVAVAVAWGPSSACMRVLTSGTCVCCPRFVSVLVASQTCVDRVFYRGHHWGAGLVRRFVWALRQPPRALTGWCCGHSRRLARSGDVGNELIDADLCRRVIQLMQAMDMRLSSTHGASKSDHRLELAMLYFISNFRKVWCGLLRDDVLNDATPSSLAVAGWCLTSVLQAYVGEQHGMPAPGRESSAPISTKQKSFKAMFDRMGLGDHLIVVSRIVQKIANNLRYWTANDAVVSQTLSLFSELAWTYSSVKLLLTLPAVSHILTHHTEEHFTFLKPPQNTRMRTTFYTALARLMFMSDEPEAFTRFMEPILRVLEALKTTVHVRSEQVMVRMTRRTRRAWGVGAHRGACSRCGSWMSCLRSVESLVCAVTFAASCRRPTLAARTRWCLMRCTPHTLTCSRRRSWYVFGPFARMPT